MTREEAEAEVNKLGLTGQERAKKINELMGKKASDFEGGTAKENPKKTLKEKLVATPEDLQNMTKDREDVKGSIRRSEIANPAVNVVDRITGNVTGLNEDLFDPTAIKAKDLDETGNLKAKDFHLGGDIEGNFIGAEEGNAANGSYSQSATSGSNVSDNKTSSPISRGDKNFAEMQDSIADYGEDTENARQDELETKRHEDALERARRTGKDYGNINDHLVENIPTFVWQRYKNGEFGEPGSKDAKLRLAHFMISGLQSTLKTASNAFAANAGRTPVFADTTSDYEKYQQTNLAQGLENRWKKNQAELDDVREILKSQNMNEQEIENSIAKVSANARLQSKFNMMNENQKIYTLKVLSKIGNEIGNMNDKDFMNTLIGFATSGDNLDWQKAAELLVSRYGKKTYDTLKGK